LYDLLELALPMFAAMCLAGVVLWKVRPGSSPLWMPLLMGLSAFALHRLDDYRFQSFLRREHVPCWDGGFFLFGLALHPQTGTGRMAEIGALRRSRAHGGRFSLHGFGGYLEYR
jgi:hypothetical protein